MATSSRRDVKLVVQTESVGEENLRRLGSEFRTLAKAGGEIGPALLAAADQLDRLADQSRAVEGFKALAAQVEDLAAQQSKAAAASADLAQDLTAQGERVEALRAKQAEATAAVRAQQETLAQARAALRALSTEFDAAGRKTEEFRTRTAAERAAVEAAAASLREKKAALTDINTETGRAVAAEGQLAAEYRQVAQQAGAGTQALRDRRLALADAAAAAQALGVETTDLAAAETRLREAQAATTRAVIEAQDQQRQAAEAAEAAALALAEAQERGRTALQAGLAPLREGRTSLEAYRGALAAVEAAVQGYAQALGSTAPAALERLEAEESRVLAVHREQQAELQRLGQALTTLGAAEIRAAESSRAAADARVSNNEALAREAAIRAELAATVRTVAESYGLESREALAVVAAIEKVAASSAEAAAQASRLAAARNEQREADRLARLEEQGLADAMERARAAAQSELAAIAESEAFMRRYAASVREAGSAATLAATSAGRALESAFGQVGLRSMQAIEAEIVKTEAALSLLQRQARAGAISQDELARAVGGAQVKLAALKREIETTPAVAGAFERLSGQINGLIGRFGALTAAVATVGIAVKPVLDATIALDQMTRTLTKVTGSAQEAGRQIEFVRNVAQRAGQEFSVSGEAFAKFAASALQAGIASKTVREVFESVTLAAGNLGLSTDQTKRALEALGQIASKGVAQMEELRQQLGDALPGVLPLLAKELGLTTAELNKVVESGGLVASEAIPAIGRAIRTLGPVSGQVSGIVQEFNRFKNALLEAGTVFVTGPFGGAIGAALQTIGFVLTRIAFGVATISEGFKVAGVVIYETINLIVNRDMEAFRTAVGRAVDESVTKLAGLSDRMRDVGDGASAAAEHLGAIEPAATAAATATAATGDAAERASQSLVSIGSAATQAAQGHAAVAQSAGAAAKATEAASTVNLSSVRSYAQLSLQLEKQESAAKRAARAAEDHTEAAKQSAKAIESLARLSGDDARAKTAQAQASRVVAVALQQQADAEQRELAVLVRGRADRAEYLKSKGQTAEQIAVVVKKLDEEIQKKTAEIEKSREAAEAARVEAEEKRLLAEATRDNTSRTIEYRNALDDARAVLDVLVTLERDGLATKAQVAAATEEVVKAQRLYSDAVRDTAARVAENTKALEADASVRRAGLDVQLAEAKAKEDLSQRLGLELSARQQVVRQREIELQIQKDDIALAKQKAELEIQAVEQLRSELQAVGELTPELARSLDLRLKDAQAAQLQADAKERGIVVLQRELDALRRNSEGLSENTRARSRNTGADPSINTGAVNQLASASGDVDRRNATRLDPNKVGNRTYDSQGFATNPDGSRITGGTFLPKPPGDGWEWVAALNQGYPYGGYWKRGQEVYTGTGRGNELIHPAAVPSYSNLGILAPTQPVPYNFSRLRAITPPPPAADTRAADYSAAYDLLGVQTPAAASSAIQAASAAFRLVMNDSRASADTKRAAFVNYAKIVLAANGGTVTSDLAGYAARLGVDLTTTVRDVGVNTGTSKTTIAPSDSGGSSSHTVTIDLGGRATTINTASAGDATALVSLLRQLETAAGRGG